MLDRSETVARNHLIFRGFPHPVYEPDGNVPPDFSIDGRIGVEVRRLNENEQDSSSPRGLEETEIPLLMGMQELTKSFGPAGEGAWWLRLRYGRPMPPWKKLKASAKAFLTKLRDERVPVRSGVHLHENVEVEAIPRSGSGGDMFHVAIMSDEDSGGWVFDLLERNLRLCIDEKTAKIAPYRGKYGIWWLLLVDHIAYGLSEFDRSAFRTQVRVAHSWDKVILVNPLDHTHYFEL